MKQKDPNPIPAQSTARSTRAAAPGTPATPATNQSAGETVLQSAQTVVAPAARKKAVDRTGIGTAPEEILGAVQEQQGAQELVAQPVIGNPDSSKPGKVDLVLSNIDTRHPMSKRTGQETKLTSESTTGVIPPARERSPGSPHKTGSNMQTALHDAVTFDANGKEQAATLEMSPDCDPHEQDSDSGIGALQQERPRERMPIVGIDDRVPYMAMAPGATLTTLRPPRMAKTGSIKPLRPKSRAECERRCGCDPSSDLGCGGVFCKRKYDGV